MRPTARACLIVAGLLSWAATAPAQEPDMGPPAEDMGPPPVPTVSVKKPVDLFLPPGTFPPPPPPRIFGHGEPSRVIYPDQQQQLRFSHAQHLAMKTECVFCHEGVTKSVSSHDRLLPREEVCDTCHDIDHDQPLKKTKLLPAGCATCHPGFPRTPAQTLSIPPPNLKFNHQIHLNRKIGCQVCHGDLTHVEMATRAQLPRMAVCLSCHDDGLRASRLPAVTPARDGKLHGASPRCGTCHILQRDGTVQVNYESGVLIPSGNWRGDAHGLGFKREHRSVAQNDPAYCQSCHRQEWCQSCHNGVVKPMDFHGNDYVSRHPLDARRNDPGCGACHRRQTFCLGCHERLGIVDKYTLSGNPQPGAFLPGSTRRFHPVGWASPTAGPEHHAWEAQRNIRSCVSCHRESTCLQCHSALPGGRIPGGAADGVDPHPIGWADSSRCQSLADRNPRVCLKCHAASSAHLRCQK